MEFTSDYIMRQILGISQMLAKILLNKGVIPTENFGEQESESGAGLLYQRLKRLLDEGKINEAENLLFDELKANATPQYFKAARLFYEDLNQLDDARLEECNFSRREILDGLMDAQSMLLNQDGDAVG